MKPYFDNEFMQVYFKEGVLFLVWKEGTKNFSNESFKVQATNFINATKESNAKKIIVDMRKFNFALNQEILKWREENIISVYNDLKLKKFAFITLSSAVKQDDPKNTFITKSFTNTKDALNWLLD